MVNKSEMSAYELLEHIQKKYLELKGLNAPVQISETVAKELMKKILGKEDVSEEYTLFEETHKAVVLNTKYQDPYMYWILRDMVQEIEEIKEDIFENTNLDTKMPCFGTIDFGMFSAEICVSKCNEKLIIISNGLFTFANLISKVIAQTFLLEESEDGQKFSVNLDEIFHHIENSTDVKLRFFDLMLACLLTREPPRAKQYILDNRLNSLLSIIRDSFEIFVVAHEYSHSVLGHLSDKSISATSKLEEINETEIEQIFHNWDDEIEADLFGALLTLKVMVKRGFDSYVSMLGIIVCTNSFELFDKLEMLRLGKVNERVISKSHPPGALREKFIEKKFFEEDEMKLFENVDKIFEKLWESFESFWINFKSMIEDKLKLDIYEIPFELVQSIMYHMLERG